MIHRSTASVTLVRRVSLLSVPHYHQSSFKKTTTLAISHLSSTTSTGGGDYVSPYSSFFSMIPERTSLGSDSSQPYTSSPNKLDPAVPRLKCGIPESHLNFRTTCYGRLELPPYVMPNEYKLTMKVPYHRLMLDTELEKKIFLQIVGPRFQDERLQLSSGVFASRIENKRHLCFMLDRIVLGTKRLAREVELERQQQPPNDQQLASEEERE